MDVRVFALISVVYNRGRLWLLLSGFATKNVSDLDLCALMPGGTNQKNVRRT